MSQETVSLRNIDVPFPAFFCGFAVHFRGWTLDIGYSAFVLFIPFLHPDRRRTLMETK